ncbi:aminopeptidase O isoform X3 [Heterocephalus glaber]|uniref:Aminopeptidase O isoform X3 n=1 Tax=Heterocephalus glaber TaxID=10181 RepID=A0AAX6T0L6_HETGA|nr:aminopeptidase O isoform X3 [Heterocephalus glaber]
MEIKLDPSRDDLPLMANTSHMLVKHYVLDLEVDFESRIIEGTIVLFFEDGSRFRKQTSSTKETCQLASNKAYKFRTPELCHIPVTNARTTFNVGYSDFVICDKGEEDTSDKDGNHDNQEQASGISSSKYCCDTENHGREDFLLVLDCCDLSVLKVEEVDVAAVPGIEKFIRPSKLTTVSEELRNEIVHELVTLPAVHWRKQLDYFVRCSQAPSCGELFFDTDTWSLQIRKTGAQTATDFPHAIRISYKTKPEGQSVTWTSDQSGRPCVYTMGSPINNRALFPCQEPPVAMSTWQATVRAAASFVVLMSGENSAKPTQLHEGCSSWHYYVTMPMPASTFTIAVGCWTEVVPKKWSSNDLMIERPFPLSETDCRYVGVCSHMEYPCRFQNAAATTQKVIPHRVFAPGCLKGVCQEILLRLLPPCLSAAHSVLGSHPFSRLDILIVPANFSSLGMASPHIIFLSQSTLTGRSHLCGPRLCHEIAHTWFGLAIGARDWTEEWLSEGFATHLEDVFWAEAQQLAPHDAEEQRELRACLRWHRLRDELRNSPEEMQVLRPSKEKTGHVSDSGASVVKHGLNPEKNFMQVHYLKGYFLLRFLARRLGDKTYFSFLRKFVHKFHGQLILSQDFLQMLLENIPEEKRPDLSVENIFQDWLESSGIPKLLPDQLVLLLEHLLEEKTLSRPTLQTLQRTYCLHEQDAEALGLTLQKLMSEQTACKWMSKTPSAKSWHGDVPGCPRGLITRPASRSPGGHPALSEGTITERNPMRFAIAGVSSSSNTSTGVRTDMWNNSFRRTSTVLQAMGVYLYGELMVSEDARQQQLARRCFELVKEQMDRSSVEVVAEMLF